MEVRIKTLGAALVILLAGCASQQVSGFQASSVSVPHASVSVVQPAEEGNFFGFRPRLNTGQWRIVTQPNLAHEVGIIEFNQGQKCRPGFCPRLQLQSSGSSDWKSWFDKDGKYVGFGPCGPATMYAKPVRKQPDVLIGDVMAEYYESAACKGGSPRRSWLIRGRNLIILGLPAENDGTFVDTAVLNQVFAESTWKE